MVRKDSSATKFDKSLHRIYFSIILLAEPLTDKGEKEAEEPEGGRGGGGVGGGDTMTTSFRKVDMYPRYPEHADGDSNKRRSNSDTC